MEHNRAHRISAKDPPAPRCRQKAEWQRVTTYIIDSQTREWAHVPKLARLMLVLELEYICHRHIGRRGGGVERNETWMRSHDGCGGARRDNQSAHKSRRSENE